MHIGRTPYEDVGRDQSDASTSKVMPKTASHQRVGERQGPGLLSQSSEGTSPADTLVLGFQPLEL